MTLTVTQMADNFAVASGQVNSPDLSADLVWEEAIEWNEEVDLHGLSVHSPVDELKELADLVYVCYGRARVMGYDLEEAINRVHGNNMGRMYQPDGTIMRRDDGKIMKNKDYPKVDLSDLV